MSKWKLLRMSLIVFIAVSSLFAPLEPQVKPPIGWPVLGAIFIFTPFGLFLVIGMQSVNPLSAKVWRKPDWDINPFNFRDPVQFFYFGAFLMLAQGIVTLCRIAFTKAPFYPESLIPLVMGLGMLLGVRIIMFAFRSKYSENT